MQRVDQLPSLPQRPQDAHKGTFGKVLIIAGSKGMSGAACLSGLGALRGGAGLVYVAVPMGILPIVAAVEPSYLTIPLPEDPRGRLTARAQSELKESLKSISAVAIGPGCGLSDSFPTLVEGLMTSLDKPLVIDADGLNAIAKLPKFPNVPDAPRVLTPHPGEFGRLVNQDINTVQKNRESLAAEYAKANRVVVLLKGNQTVITDGDRLTINPTGNSGMATGGTGDVLTGVITALLGQGLEGFEAAQLGAYLHGLAGDLAAEEHSQPGLIASDVAAHLGAAWKKFLKKT